MPEALPHVGLLPIDIAVVTAGYAAPLSLPDHARAAGTQRRRGSELLERSGALPRLVPLPIKIVTLPAAMLRPIGGHHVRVAGTETHRGVAAID